MSVDEMPLTAPFPWFGGKRRVASLVWKRFGATINYVEPFAGSLAVLLGRPHEARIETVNDKDCFICNFWRAVASDPDAVAHYADWPVNEADLHARHQWLHNQADFVRRMDSDPDYYDTNIAGWWVWGISAWIGDNWCRVNPQFSLPHMGGGKGVHRETLSKQMPHVGDAGRGVNLQALCFRGCNGDGSNTIAHSTKRPVLQDKGVHCHRDGLFDYMCRLSERLRRVRVCCGDWSRICGPTPTFHCGTTAVFLDPPYASDRDEVYNHDSFDLAHEVREWCKTVDENPKMRIALCGYEGEHNELELRGWDKAEWKAHGGYGNKSGNDNRHKERIWFSPHCLPVESHQSGRLF